VTERTFRQIVEDHLCESIPQGLADLIGGWHRTGVSRDEILVRIHGKGATRQTITGLMCEAYLDRLLQGGQS
jgi:hypothetical protein